MAARGDFFDAAVRLIGNTYLVSGIK